MESTNSYGVEAAEHSGALLEVQGLPAVSLEHPELSLASLISQSQDIPEAKHVSKFNGFVLFPSASISLGLEIPESGRSFAGPLG